MKTRLVILTALAVVTVGLLAPLPAAARTAASLGCPPEDSTAKQLVSHFLTVPHLAERRQAYGIGAVRPEDLVLLTSSADGEACRRLAEVFATSQFNRPPYRPAFYKAGDVYLVTFGQHRSPRHAFRTRYIPVVVLDKDFQPVGGATL